MAGIAAERRFGSLSRPGVRREEAALRSGPGGTGPTGALSERAGMERRSLAIGRSGSGAAIHAGSSSCMKQGGEAYAPAGSGRSRYSRSAVAWLCARSRAP